MPLARIPLRRAAATEVISQPLTGVYLQYEAIKAQQKVIRSHDHTTIYIPVGRMGVPLVVNLRVGPTAEQAGPRSR